MMHQQHHSAQPHHPVPLSPSPHNIHPAVNIHQSMHGPPPTAHQSQPHQPPQMKLLGGQQKQQQQQQPSTTHHTNHNANMPPSSMTVSRQTSNQHNNHTPQHHHNQQQLPQQHQQQQHHHQQQQHHRDHNNRVNQHPHRISSQQMHHQLPSSHHGRPHNNSNNSNNIHNKLSSSSSVLASATGSGHQRQQHHQSSQQHQVSSSQQQQIRPKSNVRTPNAMGNGVAPLNLPPPIVHGTNATGNGMAPLNLPPPAHQRQQAPPPTQSQSGNQQPHLSQTLHAPLHQHSNPKIHQQHLNQPNPNSKNSRNLLLNVENIKQKHSSGSAAAQPLPATSVQLQQKKPPSSPQPLSQQVQQPQIKPLAIVTVTPTNVTQSLSPPSVSINNATEKIIEVSAADESLPQTTLTDTLANNKEKTPMCLVNELARFNKIQHQYRLTGEQGPPHKKRFTVTLKLGDEEYTSDEASIKKAQHMAAADAISKTKYKHPPAKNNRIRSNGRIGNGPSGNLTPTVELNALAMKRGETTKYEINFPRFMSGITPPSESNPYAVMLPNATNQFSNYHTNLPNNSVYHHQRYNYDRRQMGGSSGGAFVARAANVNKMHLNKFSSNSHGWPLGTPDDPYRVTLHVGNHSFVGLGNTLQSARHDAASKALDVLKPITNEADANDATGTPDDVNSDLKSPISLVYEIVLKRNLSVGFKVLSEKGPPHMKTFVTQCIVGNITTEGEGNGKKISKKRAAETMLNELRLLPPVSPTQTGNAAVSVKNAKMTKRKPPVIKKKTRNLIKEQTEEDTEDVNPISRLIHIAQGNKSKEPEYTLLDERGSARRREFVMQVAAVNQTAQGVGSTKKLAKRQAAENLLTLLGFCRTNSPNQDALSIRSNNETIDNCRKVTFSEHSETVPVPSSASTGGSAGRQLVPGLLLVQQDKKGYCTTMKSNINSQTTATIAKELLNAGTSPTADALAATKSTTITLNGEESNERKSPIQSTSTHSNSGSSEAIRPKGQLLYLAALLGFEVQFSDFPKGNHGEYLTLITLSTEPPQLCHGAGNSTEASHDKAAVTALKILSELGLDNVVPKKSQTDDSKKVKPILSNGVKK